ncbi:MAG: phage tail tape measure protein, partial [Phreatobacter sp.]|nr:phage tail tape measure protein [Phreatobacter sp.]
MAEMKASLILELVDRLTGKTGPARRELDRLNASQGRFAATSAGLRATAVRSGNTTLVATRAIGAQARATDRLAASTGRYNAHIVSLHRRAEGGGPSAMALGRTYAMTRAFDHLNRKAEEYIAISRRRPRAERDAMAAAATARGAQVSYFGLMRRDERLRGGAFNGVAGGVAAARWSRRGRAAAAAGPQPSGSVAEAAAVPGGLARGAGAALAGRAGMMAAGGLAGAAAGAVALVAASTPDALSLERAMSDVRRATGATNAELDDYQKRVLTIARATGRTKEEVAGLMAAGASERRRGNDLVSYASLAARASQVWGERASRTGETLSTLGNIYRANQPRLEGIADAIQTAATATRTKATDLAGFLREVGQESQAAGLSAENMTAYGAALRAAGAEASASHKAMSSIVSTLSDASNQGGDFDKALRSMGLRTRNFAQAFRRDANGTILDFLNRLNRLAPDKRDSAISNIFGSDQADEIKRLAEQVD